MACTVSYIARFILVSLVSGIAFPSTVCSLDCTEIVSASIGLTMLVEVTLLPSESTPADVISLGIRSGLIAGEKESKCDLHQRGIVARLGSYGTIVGIH